MKAASVLFFTACLFSGCTSSESNHNSAFHFTDPPPPSSIGTLQPVQPVMRGEAPPLIFVGGEFTQPGRYAWTNGMTLRDAFAVAGGLTVFAESRIRLKHWDGSVERYKWSPKNPLTNNPTLRPGDSILNPKF